MSDSSESEQNQERSKDISAEERDYEPHLPKINNPTLQNIVGALTTDDDARDDMKAYYSESQLVPSDIKLEVEDVGIIELPLTPGCIESLTSVSSRSKNAGHEISAQKLRVTIEQSSLTRLLDKFREELQIGDVSPCLHNMLIFGHGHGQDLDLNQDTDEETDNVVATLVVVLPSAHIGGDLVIHQGVEKHVFSTENFDEPGVKCIAFLSDSWYKIVEVKYGYRVALTFKLALNSVRSVPDEKNRKLKDAIQEYFCSEQSEDPRKLVYFLNHTYSEEGLEWGLLKGSDRINASSILKAAKSLHLVPHLANADIGISLNWSIDEMGNEEDTYELLLKGVSLSHWIDSSNTKLNHGKLAVGDKEICWTKDVDAFKPYWTRETRNAYYAFDIDFSYRRAAVVLWAKSQHAIMNFLCNPETALEELQRLTSAPGNEKLVTDVLRTKALEYLFEGNKFNTSEEKFTALSDIVLYARDKCVATKVLSHCSELRWKAKVSTAGTLAKLQNEFGVDWFIDILSKGGNLECDIDKVDEFVRIFLQNRGDVKIAKLLLENQNITKKRSSGQSEGFVKLKEVFKACEVIQDVPLLHGFIEDVEANPEQYPFLELADLYMNMKDEMSSSFYAHFKPLKAYLLKEVESSLECITGKGWSLKVTKFYCPCIPCSKAKEFLASETDRATGLKLDRKVVRHVMDKLNDLELPIDMDVDKRCSSYKLIIEKKPFVYEGKKLTGIQELLNLP